MSAAGRQIRSRWTGNSCNRGFTLIELAVVVAIIALLIGVGVNAISAQMTNRAIAETKAKKKIIEQALRSFISTAGRLPCPAGPALGAAAGLYGVEGPFTIQAPPQPPICQGAQVIANPFGAPLPGGARGIVPWNTLGLPDTATLDGWGRRFTYLVSVSATNPNPIPLYVTNPPNPNAPRAVTPGMRGVFTVHSGNPATPGTPNTAFPAQNQINSCLPTPPVNPQANACNRFAVAVLISHGPNGLGAWLPSGGGATAFQVTLPIAGSIEIENTDLDERVIDLPVTQVNNPNPLTAYDDFVTWWTPNDLLQPLIATGAIDSPQSAMVERLDRIEGALLGFSASDLLDPDAPGGGPPCICPGLPAQCPVGCRTTRRRLPFAEFPIAAPNVHDGLEDAVPPPPVAPVFGGSLPYTTLGLNATDAVDVWGRPIYYWVLGNVPLTNPVAPLSSAIGLFTNSTATLPALPANSQPAGIPFVLPAIPQNTAYVLFSVGPDGTTNNTVAGDTVDDVIRFGNVNRILASMNRSGLLLD